MDNANEPKDNIDQMIDKALSGPVDGGQQGESSTPSEQPKEVPSSTGEVQKTQETVQKPETDKGFANHPAWQEREAKLKEAREQLQAEQRKAAQLSQLLDDLKKQQAERQVSAPTGDKFQALAEKVCTKLGWNINQLNEEQKAYVQDSVKLTMGILEEAGSSMFDSRLRPLEEMAQRMAMQEKLTQEEAQAKKMAAEKFPMFKWDEHIVPSITKLLNELDKTDPERKQQFSYDELVYRAVVPLYQEHIEAKTRQEARAGVKQNARPLGAGPSSKASESGPKKSFDQTMNAILDAHGVRP